MTSIDKAAVDGLAAGFQGRLIRPDDPTHEEVRRIWNGHVEHRPALIAQCSGVADVIAAVRFARDHDLNPAVRGGGHAVAGHALCDDGLVIDLSMMTGSRSTARTHRPGGKAAASTPTSSGRPRPLVWRPLVASAATPASAG